MGKPARLVLQRNATQLAPSQCQVGSIGNAHLGVAATIGAHRLQARYRRGRLRNHSVEVYAVAGHYVPETKLGTSNSGLEMYHFRVPALACRNVLNGVQAVALNPPAKPWPAGMGQPRVVVMLVEPVPFLKNT